MPCSRRRGIIHVLCAKFIVVIRATGSHKQQIYEATDANKDKTKIKKGRHPQPHHIDRETVSSKEIGTFFNPDSIGSVQNHPQPQFSFSLSALEFYKPLRSHTRKYITTVLSPQIP